MGKNIKSKSSNKFSLRQFAWNGFNMTVGIAFLGSLALLANKPTADDPNNAGLGLNMIWIFLIMALVTGTCAFAFAKLARYHNQDNNGGSYIFARSAFGRLVGFIICMLGYILIPLLLANQILMFVKANLDPTMSTGGATGPFWWSDWTTHLGNWKSLVFDLVGVALSAFFCLVAFFGAKTYKKVAKYSLIVKWASAGFLILFGVVAACLPQNSGNIQSWADNSSISFSTFLKAFCACFYYFTGFETFATAGKTVKEPEKNVSRGIMIVTVAAGIFYIVMTLLFMFAQTTFTQNIMTGFWIPFRDGMEQLQWLFYAGPIIMIISTIAMRGNMVSQTTLYGGATLQPLSQEGYISDKFAQLNSSHFPANAMKLNIIIVSITIGVWLIIPDILVGIFGPEADFININTIISATSVFWIVIYVFILAALLKYGFKGIIGVAWYEGIIYILAMLCLSVVFAYHYYDLFKTAFAQGAVLQDKVALGIEMGFVAIVIIMITCIYMAYYKPKYNKRMKSNSASQKKLNYEFRVLDGWLFLKGKIYANALSFFSKRSKLVNDHYDDLSSEKFQKKYEKSTESFLRKSKKQLMNYLQYSESIQHYNAQKGNDSRKEVFVHNQEAVKFMTQVQTRIKTKPADYLFLSTINKEVIGKEA